MQQYEWKVLNRFDVPRPEFHTKVEEVDTGLSKALVQFLLVENVDTGGGYIRTVPIETVNVTPRMLQVADPAHPHQEKE